MTARPMTREPDDDPSAAERPLNPDDYRDAVPLVDDTRPMTRADRQPWVPIRLRPDPKARGYIPPAWYPWRGGLWQQADTSSPFGTKAECAAECARRNAERGTR